ncbi:cuticle protein 1 [Adelges cooleyi]|uniref:cuticle protein 1 n=1 Tax=Adelges cooleyi TaxID=133065 RepID=UPI0021806ACD|nr:cuticle protein 1 [Adelges cooleyi]
MLKLFAVIFAAQTVFAGAARYPSGVNPALCPNYPHCDNALLAAYAQPAQHHAHYSPHYDDGHHYNDGTYNHQPAVPLPYTEPGYPAGVSSSSCPNYPYCSHQVPAEALRYNTQNRYQSGPAYNNYY